MVDCPSLPTNVPFHRRLRTRVSRFPTNNTGVISYWFRIVVAGRSELTVHTRHGA